jgi:very-short-patch-repair endonuclease
MNSMDSDEVKRLAKRSQKEQLENNFASHWVLLFGNLPEPVRQHPVLNPETGRYWKLDFAWVPEQLCVEIQGGSWTGGGHNTAMGQAKDYTRHNYLVRRGWRILYFNTPMLKHMAAVVTEVAEVLCNAK